MVIYHFCYDLTANNMFPKKLMFFPAINFLQVFFAALFVAISGASSVFSQRPWQRTAKLAAAAILVTVGTYLFDSGCFVWFGILHLLASASLIYCILKKPAERLSIPAVIWTGLFAASYIVLYKRTFDVSHLWVFGICDSSFNSSDYFPLVPWIFIYFFGVHIGKYILKGKAPEWFYNFKEPFFSWIGRNTLAIYLLHQPVLMAIVWIILKAVY